MKYIAYNNYMYVLLLFIVKGKEHAQTIFSIDIAAYVHYSNS
jgi:hypothetical protein